MSEFNITVEGGTSKRLPTGGKYCDRDIIVTAEGGGEPVELQEKTVTPTKSAQRVESDGGYGGLSAVNVEPIPDEYIVPSGTKEITENDFYDVREYEYVDVYVGIGGTPWYFDNVDGGVWYDNSDGSYIADYDNMACPYCGARLQASYDIDGNPCDTNCPVCSGAITLLDGNADEREGGGASDTWPYYYDTVDKMWWMNDDLYAYDYEFSCPYCAGKLQTTSDIDGNPQDTNCPYCSGAITLVDGQAEKQAEWKALYQRVEYITPDGEAYIITDFIADNTCGMEMVLSFPSFADHTWSGSRIDSGNTRFFAPYAYSASIWYAGFNANVKISAATQIATIYRCQVNFVNSRLATVYDEAGTLKGSAAISATLTAHTCPICICTQNYAGIPRTSRIFNLYSTRCSRGNDIVREYIPCYRKSDGEIGLYEKFTGAFLTAPVGAFTKGADIDW